MLSALTVLVNLLSLGGSLWLGTYIVTRSTGSLRSWLAALALWFLAIFFLRNILLFYLADNLLLHRLRLLGMLGLTFWFHLILLLLPGRPGGLLQLLSQRSVRAGLIGLAYGLASVLIVEQFLFPQAPVESGLQSVYIQGRASRASSPTIVAYILVVGSVTLAGLWQAWAHARDVWLRRLITSMLWVTFPALLAGLYLTLGPYLYPTLPALPADAALGVSMLFLGYNVARYDALVEGRTIERDALYSAIGTGLVVAVYGLVILPLRWSGQASFLALLLILLCAILSHSLYDGARSALDRLFYRGQFRQLRANLRALAREAGTSQELEAQLQATLDALCRALGIRKGFIALRHADAFIVHASERASVVGQTFPPDVLETDQLVALPRPGSADLQDMALLLPLCGGGSQLGALLLGARSPAQPYDESDLELLENLADEIAAMLHAWRVQQENVRTINQMVTDFRERERALQRQVQQILAEREAAAQPLASGPSETDLATIVEECLRRLDDFSFLGDHGLARLHVVAARLDGRPGPVVTHIERGQVVHGLLVEAVNKLRPAGREPAQDWAPGREWHPFIVLHDAYVAQQLTRDIMGRLNISEPTFHRIRRRAIRSVAKALWEMEQVARRPA
jgi:hypothetical protein